MGTGTGKTACSLAIYTESPCTKLLVISPAGIKCEEWVEDILKWTETPAQLIPQKRYTPSKQIDRLTTNQLVASYDEISNRPWLLDWVDSDTFIILDESHNIKSSSLETKDNFNSRTEFIVEKLGPLTEFKLVMSATPQSKGYIDIYPQLKFLGEIKMTPAEFKEVYCVMGLKRGLKYPVLEIKGYNKYLTSDLDKKINHKAVWLKENPNLKLNSEEHKVIYTANEVYKKFKKDNIVNINGNEYFSENMSSKYLNLQTIAMGYAHNETTFDIFDKRRTDWLKDFLLATVDRRVAIFVNRVIEEQIVKHLIQHVGRPLASQTGSSKSYENGTKDNVVWVVNYKSGAEGWDELRRTETLVSTAVFFSPPPSLINFQQAKGRLISPFQEYHPSYYYLACSGTHEVKAYNNFQKGLDFDYNLQNNY